MSSNSVHRATGSGQSSSNSARRENPTPDTRPTARPRKRKANRSLAEREQHASVARAGRRRTGRRTGWVSKGRPGAREDP
jgi:hypothetical protein